MRLTAQHTTQALINEKMLTTGQMQELKLSQHEDMEDKLGFGLLELTQMLINGIWEVGAVDSETMLPVSQGITHFHIYGIDFENKKIKVFYKVGKEILFSELDLDKYKKKCLSGWALTKEELLNE